MGRVNPTVLTIGTTHPLNIAGVGLDLRVAAGLGVRVVTVVAGISAQNARSVLAAAPVEPDLLAAQFAALADVAVGAIHIGALVGAASVAIVARELARFDGIPVVCDPVIAASTGERLADDATVAALRDVLFARCTLVTPNLHEAALLAGRSSGDDEEAERAGAVLRSSGAAAVLVKGGHLLGDPIDVLISARGTVRFEGSRIAGSLRGTGDLLACAVAARLAHGDGLEDAVEFARRFVRECIGGAVLFAGARTLP